MLVNIIEVKNAFFIGIGFRGAVADDAEYARVLEVWARGEVALIDRFQHYGGVVAALFEDSRHPSKNDEQAEVSKRLGAWVCDHVYRLGHVPEIGHVTLEARRLALEITKGGF